MVLTLGVPWVGARKASHSFSPTSRPHAQTHAQRSYKIAPWMPLRLGHPYPVAVDPTRTAQHLRYLRVATRDELEMHHMSLVRDFPRGLLSKVGNVSNRANYFTSSAAHSSIGGGGDDEEEDEDDDDHGAGGGGGASRAVILGRAPAGLQAFLREFEAFEAKPVRA
jgi:hypothetical protein